MVVIIHPYPDEIQPLLKNPCKAPESFYKNKFIEYLLTYELDAIEALLGTETGPTEEDVAVEVLYADLADYDGYLAVLLVNHPVLLMKIFNTMLYEAQVKVCKHEAFTRKNKGKPGKPKRKAQIRLMALPAADKYLTKSQISVIRADEIDRFVQFTGTIVRTGSRKMLELEKQYSCQACGHFVTVCADPEQENMIPTPRACANMRIKRGSDIATICGSTYLREIENSRRCVDYQEIKVQDQVERLGLGCVPRSIMVVLEADLVDKHNAGEDVIIVGTVLRQWRPVILGSRIVIDIAIKANSITSLDPSRCEESSLNDLDMQHFEQYWAHYRDTRRVMMGRNIIIKSICAQLYGLFYVKLALVLTLIGGGATQEESGVRRRQQSHLLLVGDPGCGKSQLLKYASSLVPRSVLTTGIGTTGAGLTCAAVKDDGEWHLEAGALVLSNNGLCCIDEFSSIKEADRATIHEAMEQQTLSVAKAGLVVKLSARSTVVACCNPKGGTYDIGSDLPTNTAIASPLLSRFDLVLVLLDMPDKLWDLRVSQFLLHQAVRLGEEEAGDDQLKATADDANVENLLSAAFGENAAYVSQSQADISNSRTQNPGSGSGSGSGTGTGSPRPEHMSSTSASSSSLGDLTPCDLSVASVGDSSGKILDFSAGEAGTAWTLHALRMYIAYVKTQYQPVMSGAAKALLTRYYQLQRQSEDRNAARTTVRLLESLLRLSEAHAKLLCRASVEIEDAVMAISLVSLSQTQENILEGAGATLHSPFPAHEDAAAAYLVQESRILGLLHVTRANLEKEGSEAQVRPAGAGTASKPTPKPTPTGGGGGDGGGANASAYNVFGRNVSEQAQGHGRADPPRGRAENVNLGHINMHGEQGEEQEQGDVCDRKRIKVDEMSYSHTQVATVSEAIPACAAGLDGTHGDGENEDIWGMDTEMDALEEEGGVAAQTEEKQKNTASSLSSSIWMHQTSTAIPLRSAASVQNMAQILAPQPHAPAPSSSSATAYDVFALADDDW